MINRPRVGCARRGLLLSLIILFTVSSSVYAADPTTAQPDNSATNKKDSSDSALTADQQSNKKSDLDLTRNIRRSLTKDDKLSLDAQNVKVITQNGKVTLKGPVRSEEEKTTVEKKAQTIAGANNVHSELQIAGS